MYYELPYYRVIDISTMAVVMPEIPYGIKMIGAELEWDETNRGKDTKVALVDTGITPHPDLQIAGFYDATTGGSTPRDLQGHGTHVAGIIGANGAIKGVAPGCDLYGVRVFSDERTTTEELIVRGLMWCLDNKMDVINMSFGTPHLPSVAFHNVVKALHAQGTILVASAGNYGLDYPRIYPAAYPEVISVAAVDIAKGHAPWSSLHDTVELAAAGVEVWSTWLYDNYANLNGTSMASPHIAGAAALMVAKARFRNKLVDNEKIRYAMGIYADDLGEPGRDVKYGFGLFSFGRIVDGEPAPDQSPIDLTFKVGSTLYWKNGQERTAYIAPRIVQSRAMVGLRDIGEAFGARVDWDGPTKTIDIKK